MRPSRLRLPGAATAAAQGGAPAPRAAEEGGGEGGKGGKGGGGGAPSPREAGRGGVRRAADSASAKLRDPADRPGFKHVVGPRLQRRRRPRARSAFPFLLSLFALTATTFTAASVSCRQRISRPMGGRAPLCRAPLKMENPCTHPVDRELEQTVRSLVASSEYELRLSQGAKIIRDLKERARTTLPIFYMSPGCRVGQPVALHLFEPRYRILIRRAMEGNNMFVYAARTPKRGHRACLVKVTSALFHRDGRANIVGFGVEDFLMEDVWIEEGTAGLYYTRFVARQGGFNPSDGVGARDARGRSLDEPSERYRGRGGDSGGRRRRRSESMSCAVQ